MTDDKGIHLGGKLDAAVLDAVSDIICGDSTDRYPKYRSSMFLTKFFSDAGVNATHDGSTRKWWVLSILEQLQPSDVEKVILRLSDIREYKGDLESLKVAVRELNSALLMDGYRVGFQNNKPVIQFAAQTKLDDEIINSPAQSDRASISEEDKFLQKQFDDEIKISDLNLDVVLTEYLQDRLEEAQNCPRGKVPLGTVFLLGSTLEGILLAVALKDQAKFMTSKLAPKDKTGAIYKIYDWKLSHLIDVCHELGFLNLDVKKFSHELRDFRNYIHPYHQMSQNFKPDQYTVGISWQVFKAAFFQLKASTT
jgi:hypothetical protein